MRTIQNSKFKIQNGTGHVRLLLAGLVFNFSLSVFNCPADITATVTPGHTFAEDEAPTVDTLNLLGQPTIQITGTLGGTNVALGAGTVSGTMLMDSVVDDVTVGYNGSSPRSIYVKNGGINSNQVAAAFVTYPLTGGGGNRLQLNFDSTLTTNASGLGISGADVLGRIVVPSNQLMGGSYLANTGAVISVGLGLSLVSNVLSTTNNWFVSTNFPIPTATGVITNVAHALGNTPAFVRLVLVCLAAERSYAVGDEINAESGALSSQFVVGANATNVFVIRITGALQIPDKSSGSLGTPANSGGNYTNWRCKIYCGP